MHAKMAAYVYDTISTIFGFKTIKYSYRLDVIQHFFFSSSYDSLLPISVTRIKHALHKMFERLFWLMAEMPTRLQHNILAMVLHPTTSIEQETKKDKNLKKHPSATKSTDYRLLYMFDRTSEHSRWQNTHTEAYAVFGCGILHLCFKICPNISRKL